MDPLTVADYEALARAKLDDNAWEYIRGGSGDETTLRENVEAFTRWKLRPRVLCDVGSVETRTMVLGTEVALPVLVAPVALQKLAHPDGEAATARAAAAAGTIMCLSTSATMRPAAVAAAAPGAPRWLQVYVFNERAVTQALIDEACAHAYSALVLTVDTPILGRREGALRVGFHVPDEFEVAGDIFGDLSPNITWRDLDGRIEVLLDGGVRRGVDVLRALALGARAVLAGRAPIWGLAAAGEEGVRAVLDLLREEVALGLALLGCRSPAEVSRAHVALRQWNG